MQKLLINYTEGAYFSSEETNKRFSFNVKKWTKCYSGKFMKCKIWKKFK
jgi:hypothetical protein